MSWSLDRQIGRVLGLTGPYTPCNFFRTFCPFLIQQLTNLRQAEQITWTSSNRSRGCTCVYVPFRPDNLKVSRIQIPLPCLAPVSCLIFKHAGDYILAAYRSECILRGLLRMLKPTFDFHIQYTAKYWIIRDILYSGKTLSLCVCVCVCIR